MATTLWLRRPPDRRVVAGYQKNAPLCDCNRGRAALTKQSDARPLWTQLRFHYEACISAMLIPWHFSATVGVHQWSECDLTLILLRLTQAHYSALAVSLPLFCLGVSLYIWFHSMTSSNDLKSFVFKCKCVVLYLEKNHDFIQGWITSFSKKNAV